MEALTDKPLLQSLLLVHFGATSLKFNRFLHGIILLNCSMQNCGIRK
jgi:hypothetical protein